MRLNELKAKKSGTPDGFTGTRARWDEVKEEFEILKAAILSRPAVNDKGEVLTYAEGPKQGQPIPDRQLILTIRGRSEKVYLVRTNSRRLTSLYSGDLEREPDSKNIFGDDVFDVEAPEGWLRFVPFEYEYSNGRKGNIADLEEAEE